MPKKRNHNFKQLQGASSSAANTRPGSSKDGSGALRESASVNERLEELRKSNGSDATQVKRNLADAVNQRSVPPELRGILGVPESAPPKPKLGVRRPVNPINPLVAGPAPPESWVRANAANTLILSIPSKLRRLQGYAPTIKDRNHPEKPWSFASKTKFASDLDVQRSPSSLLHLTLKLTAQQWDLFDEADYPALLELDLRLRVRLLSYIGAFGPAISAKAFEALLQGPEPIQFLDLGGLLGHSTLTSARLVKASKAQLPEVPKDDEVADSWDEDSSLASALAIGPSPLRFSHLTHLCLSHPQSKVSWRDLLALSKQIPQVTHLSLAYWPRPTLTPNLATASVSDGRSPEIRAGGSHIYSALDGDVEEPASLLRQLSANLLCLQWLDLEGCDDWMHPLAQCPNDPPAAGDPWSGNRLRVSSPLLGHWKNVTYVNCSQGWLPTKSGMDALPRQHMDTIRRSTALEFLKSDIPIEVTEEGKGQSYHHTAQRKANVWLEREAGAVKWCNAISALRRENHLKPLLIDHGWRTKFAYM